ncbi:L-lactate dehydrogenase [Liquorilactobacillus capillatus]|nr:L-lactate dehydrogenase [Liquorilactobacillus capillatus]
MRGISLMEEQHKVVLVGSGAVGTAFAFSLLQNITSTELIIVDINNERTQGNVLDLQDITPLTGTNFVRKGDYNDAADADLVVVTAGVPRQQGESRLDLFKKNTSILKTIITPVVASGFKGCFVTSSNPVDVLTTITQKLSGFPRERVIGSGTSLDSARLAVELAFKLEVPVQSIKNAYVLGEHGDSSFVALSKTTVLGKRLTEFTEINDLYLPRLEESVRTRGSRIIALKGATYYGVAVCLMKICRAILTGKEIKLPVSAPLTGQYGQQNIYLGTPAIIGADGIKEVIELPLSSEEKTKMDLSAKKIRMILDSLK